jgi:hypothetical protein
MLGQIAYVQPKGAALLLSRRINKILSISLAGNNFGALLLISMG